MGILVVLVAIAILLIGGGMVADWRIEKKRKEEIEEDVRDRLELERQESVHATARRLEGSPTRARVRGIRERQELEELEDDSEDFVEELTETLVETILHDDNLSSDVLESFASAQEAPHIERIVPEPDPEPAYKWDTPTPSPSSYGGGSYDGGSSCSGGDSSGSSYGGSCGGGGDD